MKKKPPIKKKYIETPERLWQLFCEYKIFCKNNPFKVKDWVGGMGKMVIREKERPLTIEGFENFCYDIVTNIDRYFANKDGAYETYRSTCLKIKREIRDDQISGGMAGIYTPSITQRLNNLVEKTQNDNNNTDVIKVTLGN